MPYYNGKWVAARNGCYLDRSCLHVYQRPWTTINTVTNCQAITATVFIVESNHGPARHNLQDINIKYYRKIKTSAFSAYQWRSKSILSLPDDPDEAIQQLDTDLISGLDRFAPLKTRTRRQGNQKSNWLSAEVLAAKKERHRLKRRYFRNRTLANKIAY